MKIGIVAGEASGDLLGSELLVHLKKLLPHAHFVGIAGPKMLAQGVESLYPMDRLSVMGISEVLGRYRELYSARKKIIRQFCDMSIDLFIGIDAPDFNLGLEKKLHDAGIKTVHYVSPSVWAWRQYRVKKIARSTDLMLTLFPFEADFYKQHNVPVKFVGHPLGDIVALDSDQQAARHLLGLDVGKKIIALLPGSRSNELEYLGESFIKIAQLCYERDKDIEFIIPFANQGRRNQFEEITKENKCTINFRFFDGMPREVMAASDVVLLASGTAALEALLLKRPMVVTYRVAPMTYLIAKKLVKLKHYSLPNLLLPEPSVPEFIQHEIVPQDVADKLMEYLLDKDKTTHLTQQFHDVHLQLRKNASETAAKAITELVE